MLPSQDLRENINQLESLFRTIVEHMTKKKLTPLAPESTKTDLKTPIVTDDPRAKLPRVLAESLRVKDRTSNHSDSLFNKSLCKTTLPKIMRNTINKQSEDEHLQAAFQKELPSHHCATRTKVARCESIVQQMEAAQTKERASPSSTLINATSIIHQMS